VGTTSGSDSALPRPSAGDQLVLAAHKQRSSGSSMSAVDTELDIFNICGGSGKEVLLDPANVHTLSKRAVTRLDLCSLKRTWCLASEMGAIYSLHIHHCDILERQEPLCQCCKSGALGDERHTLLERSALQWDIGLYRRGMRTCLPHRAC